MFLKNNFDLKKFIFFTVLNLALAVFLIELQNFEVILVLFIGFLLNQFLLLYGVISLTQSSEQPSAFKLITIFIGKFVVLAFAILYAMQNLEKNAGYALIFYIFQLIILVISIKRNTKKIKD